MVTCPPRDLETIRSNLDGLRTYTMTQQVASSTLATLAQVLEDIALVFANCREYNREESEEWGCGERLEEYCRARRAQLGL